VEMQELETMAEVLGLEQLGGGEQFRGAEAELGVFAAAFGPLAGAAGEEARADAQERFDAELLGDGNDLAEFLELFDHHDDLLAELEAEDGHLDEAGILVAVADDEAAHLILQREPGEEFGLAADFEAEIEGLAGVEDFLHHFAELVDLDGEHAVVVALVVELGDRIAEGDIDGLDAMAKDVLETDQHGELQPAGFGLLDDVGDVDLRAGFLERAGNHVAGVVDIEIFRAPAMDVVQVAGGLKVPGLRGVRRISHVTSCKRSHYRRVVAEFNR